MNRGKFGGQWGKGKMGGFWRGQMSRFAQPPVNIEETDAQYTISLYAAGLVKDNVTLRGCLKFHEKRNRSGNFGG